MKRSLIQIIFATCLMVLTASASVFASNNPVTNLSTDLRTELRQLVQNPGLAENNVTEASIVVRFRIDAMGEISVLGSQSSSPWLIRFIEENVANHHLDTNDYIPGQMYQVRFRFELE